MINTGRSNKRDENVRLRSVFRSKLFTMTSSSDRCIKRLHKVSRTVTRATAHDVESCCHVIRQSRPAGAVTPNNNSMKCSVGMPATCSAERPVRLNNENERSATVQRSCARFGSPPTDAWLERPTYVITHKIQTNHHHSLKHSVHIL